MGKTVATICVAVAVMGCRSGHGGDLFDASVDPPADARVLQPLGMNDISIVRPRLAARELGQLNGITAARDLVPRALFARLVTSHQDLTAAFDDFLVFAIRFDLCNRTELGPCPEGADGSLRLVFQSFMPSGGGKAADVGLHAFYAIPAAEVGLVVDELREIARLSATGPWVAGPLRDQSPPKLAGTPRLHALVDRYAVADRLIQLTAMGQDARATEPRVVFRGVELRDGQMVDIVIPTIAATEQVAALAAGAPGYALTPVADRPEGLDLSLSAAAFDAASPTDQRRAIDALLAADNPQLHTAGTVQCAACHVSTYLARQRAQTAGIDVETLPSRFTTTRAVSVSAGVAEANARSLHAFSWIDGDVAISNRVANETAIVLDEIERRFPAR